MLTLAIIQERMKKLKNWGLESNFIVKDFSFDSFKEAIDFVNKIGEIAQKQNHYPDIVIAERIVRLSLTTHLERGLTSADFELAEEIDKLDIQDLPKVSDASPVANEDKI